MNRPDGNEAVETAEDSSSETSERSIDRRLFIPRLAGAAAAFAGISGLASGCGDDRTGPDPSVPPDTTHSPPPVVAKITGDSEVDIPEVGQPGIGNYSSAESTGQIYSRLWTIEKKEDPLERSVLELGDDVTAQADFVRPGVYTVKLEVERRGSGAGSFSSTSMETLVNPPPLPDKDYSVVMLGGYDRLENGNLLPIMYIVSPPQLSQIHRFAANSTFMNQTISMEKTGQKFATDIFDGSSSMSLMVYDLLEDSFITISGEGERLWMSSWNPTKDWIAAAQVGGRVSGREPVLVRPDGSEIRYLSDEPNYTVTGAYPSWTPDGEKLLVAESEYQDPDIPERNNRRGGLYEGFWDGEPTRTQVPSEEQIVDFLKSRGDLTPTNQKSTRIGMGGIAISPSGEEAVYRIEYAYTADQISLVKSRLDLTGDIELLVGNRRESGLDGFFSPKWSPDGRNVFFTSFPEGAGQNRVLYKVSGSGGGLPVQVTPKDMFITTIGWYQ